MTRHARRPAAVVAAVALALQAAGCGSGSRTSSDASGGRSTVAQATAAVDGTVSMIQESYPNSLDPQQVVSPQAQEADWVTYTGLVSYAHRNGTAGAVLVPGLAETLPRISDGGRTYTVTLRPHLSFADGLPVHASDFLYSLERAVKLPWPGARTQIDPYVRGAGDFLAGRAGASTISGVSVDDVTGRIVIHLVRPDAEFDATLAQPALGLIPAGSAPLDGLRPRAPLPSGCGPYMIEHVVPGRSYELVRNPRFRALPGIPAAHVNVQVRISSDLTAAVEAVLNNTDDLLDWTSPLPASLQAEVQQAAPDRFDLVTVGGVTDAILFDRAARPFSDVDARRAVVVALDHGELDAIAGGDLAPGCDLLAPWSAASPSGRCPYAETGAGDLALARSLVRRAGTLGPPVIVWAPSRQPQRAWMTYYAQLLDQIGIHSVLRVIPAGKYPSIDGGAFVALPGDSSLSATLSTGVDAVSTNPESAYDETLDADQLIPAFTSLGAAGAGLDDLMRGLSGATTPAALDSAWQALETRVARQADVAVLGYEQFPFLASARMDQAAIVVSPIYGWDYTSLRLTGS